MNKHLTQSLKFFLLLVLALSSGCGPVTAIPSPTLTPAPSQTPSADKTSSPFSITPFFPTVTPASTRQAITPTRSLASATPEYYSIVTQQPGSECLPPLTNFAFPAGAITDLGNITPHPTTLPSANWKVVAGLPEGFDFNSTDITILANGDLWIKGDYQWERAYFIYASGKEPTIYLEEVLGKAYRYYVPDKLVQSKDGTLWGIGTDYGSGSSPWEYQNVKPLISRFSEATGRFEYLENILHDVDARSGVKDVKLDSNGAIWILLDQRERNDGTWRINKNEIPAGLYQFNPNTLDISFFLALPDDISFREMTPVSDGSIWMLGYNYSNEKAVLSRYFPGTGELQPYQGTFSYIGENIDFPNLAIPAESPLFLDSNDRLWVGTEGWLNNPASTRPKWYRIIQPPIFIHGSADNGYGGGGYGGFKRSIPYGLNESSDGMFWFWASIGTVRLNPKIGEWCLFTTYSSPVVEDSNHNLWMVADNKLYKYELGQ